MCGRYYVDDETARAIEALLRELDTRIRRGCMAAVERMAAAAFKNLNRSIDLFTAFSGEKYDKIMGRESVVDRYEDRLGSYLFHLNSRELNERETLVSSH